MTGHTWVQPWFRPLDIQVKQQRRSRSLCKHSPVGPAATWLPSIVYRAWSFRIRPDLATKVNPAFPYLTADGFRARREWLSARDEVIF